MLIRILTKVLWAAFFALLCGYVVLVFAAKPKAHLEVFVPRGCLKKIELLDDTECRIISEHNLYCTPVAVTRILNCTKTRVVK